MSPDIRIKVHDVPDIESCVRGMHSEARGLARRYPTLTACHFGLALNGAQYDAHIDINFPQHQVIVNGTGSTTERALRDAVDRAARELTRLRARDLSIAPTPNALAA